MFKRLTRGFNSMTAYFTSPACQDFSKTHDIKARVHRNLVEKPKFNASQWLEQNPKAYPMFVKYTLEAIHSGRTKLGAKAVAERVRWESALRKESDGPIINNSAVTEMALRFMAEYPQHNGIFLTRNKKAR